MNSAPRTDVLDDAELVLRSMPAETVAKLHRFLTYGERQINPRAKAAILRAAARLDPKASLRPIHAALGDEDPEVRDAAAAVLSEVGTRESRPILEKRLTRETDSVVRTSIQEALDSIPH